MATKKAPHNATPGWTTEDVVATNDREPSIDEQLPPVYENGLNTGAHIEEALEVEELDMDLYRSKSLWVPARARGVFGGQVIGQAISAANKSVRDNVRLHSLHCYFLLAGDKTIPIIYHVQRVRDGGSYVTRLVLAKQRGRSIFTIILSYQVPEPAQPTFAIPLLKAGPSSGAAPEPSSSVTPSILANIPSPDKCPLNEERYLRVLRNRPTLDGRIRKVLEEWIADRQNSAVEIRDALPGMYDERGLPTSGYEQAFWMRTRKPVVGGEEAQKVALAYSSDFYLLSTVSKALGNARSVKMMASLDHSMWFYDTFDVREWLLYVMQTQAAAHGRGVTMGRVYREDGTLVAVVSQEGLVRGKLPKEDVPPAKL